MCRLVLQQLQELQHEARDCTRDGVPLSQSYNQVI